MTPGVWDFRSGKLIRDKSRVFSALSSIGSSSFMTSASMSLSELANWSRRFSWDGVVGGLNDGDSWWGWMDFLDFLVRKMCWEWGELFCVLYLIGHDDHVWQPISLEVSLAVLDEVWMKWTQKISYQDSIVSFVIACLIVWHIVLLIQSKYTRTEIVRRLAERPRRRAGGGGPAW